MTWKVLRRAYTSYLSRLLNFEFVSFFFFNDTATTEIYTLSLHDALPICGTVGRAGSHWASETPCHVRGASAGLESRGVCTLPNRRSRVCRPASASTLIVESSCHVM